MPANLAQNLPTLSADELATLYGDLTSVVAYPRGNPIREGVINGMCLFYYIYHVLLFLI